MRFLGVPSLTSDNFPLECENATPKREHAAGTVGSAFSATVRLRKAERPIYQRNFQSAQQKKRQTLSCHEGRHNKHVACWWLMLLFSQMLKHWNLSRHLCLSSPKALPSTVRAETWPLLAAKPPSWALGSTLNSADIFLWWRASHKERRLTCKAVGHL